MHYYRAFDALIASDIVLPELKRENVCIPDVVIRVGKVDYPGLPAHDNGFDYSITPSANYFYWYGRCKFVVFGGHEIVIEMIGDVEERVVRLPLLGIIMAVLLHNRGAFLLHGSAVRAGKVAIVFLGNKGMGKSTLASALLAAGHGLISDDIVMIRPSQEGAFEILPSYPHIKLWADTIPHVFNDRFYDFHQLHPDIDKHGYYVTQGFVDKPTPLKQLYIIRRGPELNITPCTFQEAIVELVRFTYVVRFGTQLLGADQGRHFKFCAHLASNTEVLYLDVPNTLQELSKIREAIRNSVFFANSDRVFTPAA